MKLVRLVHTLSSLRTYGNLTMVHFMSPCFDVNGSKTNISLWITMGLEFLI
jgi:hypothetical protein